MINEGKIWLNAFSFLLLLIIAIVFFSKERLHKEEDNLYSRILIYSILSFFSGLILGIIISIPPFNFQRSLAWIFCKLYLSALFVVIYLFSYYTYFVSSKKEKITNQNKKFIIFANLINFIIIFLLPLNTNKIFIDNSISGPAMIYTFTFISIMYFLMFIFVLRDFKNIKKKKYIPIIFLILTSSFAEFLMFIFPSANYLLNPIIVLNILIMYFTIENPDIKMLSEVTAAKDAADKANRAKSDFLSSMSHEIRTPLNAIVGFSECIKNADSLEEAKENAADIVTASESLLEIVNGILDISKIESGKLELVQSDYDIYKILDEVVKLIKARLGDKPLNFEVNIAPDIPHVLYGDHFNIKKILINFLTNAVKYTDEGYVKFDVKCVIVNNNVCRLIMSVKDSGRGIKKENIDKLFTKFQRLDEDKNTTIEGTGLGLAITKQLVEMMHGKIVVNSIYGEGSEFTVAIDQRISNHKLETQEDVSDDVIDLTGRKILVVDDNKLNLKVAVKLLQPYKCVVETCESGFGCIDKITSGNKYDIILLDDMMPKMRGSETLTRLKADPKFNIPVVALTANAIQGMREQYMLLGFDDYLAKPIDKKELNRILNKYVLKNALVEGNDKSTKTVEEKPTISESPMEENINFQDYTGKKILIVDDNKLNVKVATKIMNPYHFEIDSAYSGLECLNKVKNTKYDIIFMDYMMPNMDGIETFKQLHEDPSFKTPVISLTADAVVGAKDKFINAGFNGYVSKPIDKKMLDDAINKALKDK